MSTPNPLTPKGSLLERQATSKSPLRIAAIIVGVHVFAIGGFLILGCKKEDQKSNPYSDITNSPSGAVTDSFTNPPIIDPGLAASNSFASPLTNPVTTNPAPIPVAVVAPTTIPVAGAAPAADATAAGATDYKVKKGDNPSKIAHAHGVTLKELLAANPGLDPKKLKVDAVIHIPAGKSGAGSAPAAAGTGTQPTTAPAGDAVAAGDTYKVKGGDTLSKIAKKYGTTIKALRQLNGLKNNNLRAGQTLKVPAAPASQPSNPPGSAPAGASNAPVRV